MYEIPPPGNQTDAAILRRAAQILRLRWPAEMHATADAIHRRANTLWLEDEDEI